MADCRQPFDMIVMENREGRPGNFTCTDESGGCEVFGRTNDLVDHICTSEAGSRGWGR